MRTPGATPLTDSDLNEIRTNARQVFAARDLDRALSAVADIPALIFALRECRTEVAALRRQNLALDAQLDHMTRVNQALDAGITTTSTQERT